MNHHDNLHVFHAGSITFTMDTPVPVTARDKLLVDTLRQLQALHAEEKKTVVLLRHDTAAL